MKFTGKDPNNINQTAKDKVEIFAGGSSIVAISGSGNVGIGTNTPTATLQVYKSGSTVLSVEGSQGSLMSVDDSLSGSLMSVGNISGLPLFEVFDDGTIVGGPYNQNTLVVTGSRVGIGTSSPSKKLQISDTGTSGVTGTLEFYNDNTSYTNLWVKSNGTGVLLSSHTSGNGYLDAIGALRLTSNSSPNQTNIWLGNGSRFRISNTAETERYLTVVTNGNILIGTTTDAGYKLHVSGSGNFTDNLTVTGSLIASAFTASSAVINGNVTIHGTASVDVLITNYESSSIIYSSGSTKFGDTMDDTHQFTGSLSQTGSSANLGNLTIDSYTSAGASTLSINSNYGGIPTAGALTLTAFNNSIIDFKRGSGNIQYYGNSIWRFNASQQWNVGTTFGFAPSVVATLPSARVGIIGTGTTSSTTALLVQNANASASLIVRDDQNVEIQGGLAVTGVTGSWIIEARGTSNSGGIRRIGNNVEFYGLQATVGYVGGAGSLDLRGYTGGSTGNTTNPAATFANNYNYNATSVNTPVVKINPSINQTGTGTYTLLNFSPTLNTTGSGTSYYISGSNYVVTSLGHVGIGTGTPTAALQVYKSGSTVFKVEGSQGELFAITDSLSGSLFSVSNISGLPILEVFSDNTILLGDYQAPALFTTKTVTANSGSTVIYSIPTASYDGAFFEYTIKSGSNARAGSVMGMWAGTDITYTDNSTTDIGSTSGFIFGLILSGSNMVLTGSASTDGWNVKTIIKSI